MGKIYIKDNLSIAAFILQELNPTIDISLLTSGSEKVVVLKCANKHSWSIKMSIFYNNPTCPFCLNRKLWTGFNDLENKLPEIAKQWNKSKNNPKLPSEILFNSNKKVWWLGDCGHEWQAVVRDRTRTDGKATNCPACAGKKVLSGYNDLVSTNPAVAAEWDFNNNLTSPENVTSGSNKKAAWVCSKGHKWESVIYDRTRTDGKATNCPTCAGKKVLAGYNDLESQHSLLSESWNHKKNNPIEPFMVTSKSGKKVWWQCEKGHEWETAVSDRSYGSGCPYCSNSKVLYGYNDLTTLNPNIAQEWNPKRNGTLLPTDVTVGSNLKVWWLCNKGHEWQATVGDRNYGYGCLKCSKSYSKKELEIQEFVKSLGFKVEANTRSIIKGELDIYVPEKRIAIEYNGLYWHSESSKIEASYHYDKWQACNKKGVQLIQIWEDDYLRNPSLIKNMLSHKLGASVQEKVYARKTEVKQVSKSEADVFLNSNHIQGSVDGVIRAALFFEEEIVAIMVLKSEAGSLGRRLNLLRYATSKNVVGGFTKLLTWVESNNPAVGSIITFSDNTVSDGGLYKNNGFIEASTIKPDYMYIVNKSRVHKFNYRLKRFKNDPDLIWADGSTEKELAMLNGLQRIWDAGKVKWVKILKDIKIEEDTV